MRRLGLYTVASLVVSLSVGADTAWGQGFSGILEKLKSVEQRLIELETARTSDSQRLKNRLKKVESGQDIHRLDSTVADLRVEVGRLSEDLEQVRDTASPPQKVANIGSAVEDLRNMLGDLRRTMEAAPGSQGDKASSKEVEGPQISLHGQLRSRSEYRSSVGHDAFTSMRSRLGIKTSLRQDLSVFMQFQDVRLWGEEGSTLGDYRADNFDLHQGYVEMGKVGGRPLSVRLGRQAIALGGQRLIGAVEWTQQGRAFDGVRITATPSGGRVDLLGIRLAEGSAASAPSDAYLAGAYIQVFPKPTTLDVYVLNSGVSGAASTNQTTFGLRWAGKQTGISYRLEGSYQAGRRKGKDVAAYLLGARLGAAMYKGKGRVTLWYDYLSGDEDPTDGKDKVFDTLFATNHKFYGYADLFLNIPVHTKGRGLQDLAVKTQISPTKAVKLGIDFHVFMLAQKRDLASRRLAEEVDLTLVYKYSPDLSFVGGFSYVYAGEGLGAIGKSTKDSRFGYLMSNVTF